jgi:hypothetical protein
MPKAQQDYYYSYARQNFINFADEEDPARIDFLIQRGDEHINFIVKKYDLDLQQGGAHFDKQFWNSAAASQLPAANAAAALETAAAAAAAAVGMTEQSTHTEEPPRDKFGKGAGSEIAATQTRRMSRPLNGVVVEADVLGQLLVVEVHPGIKVSAHPADAPIGRIQAGDVLVEIDGTSIRGAEPASLSVKP